MTETLTSSDVTSRNVDLVNKMYELFNKGEIDRIKAEVFSPTLRWTLPGRSPVGGLKKGPDEVCAFFAGLVDSGIQVDIIKIAAWGEDTVVETHRGHGTSRGASLDALNCTHYRIENGLIEEVQVYMSDQYAADNFFWAAIDMAPIPDRWAKSA